MTDVEVTDTNSVEQTAIVEGELAPGATGNVTFTHVVDEDDVKAGSVVNVATVGKDKSNEVTTDVEGPREGVTLVKSVTSGDKEYKYGETITYTVQVTNTGNVTLTDVEVTDTNSVEQTAIVEGELAPGATGEVTFTHVVDEDDVKAGSVVNVATVGEDESNEVTTDVEEPREGVALVKSVTSGDKEYKYGETITYTVQVTNTGNVTLTNVEVTDTNSVEQTAIVEGELAPGATGEVTFTHVVDEDDVKEGSVVNVATVGEDESNEVTTDVEGPREGVTLVKSVTSGDKEYKYGETITYTVQVTNTGNVTLTNVEVTDTNSVEQTAIVEGELAPGATGDVTFTHVVDEDDVKAGSVVNVATVGEDESNEVTTDVEGPREGVTLVKSVTSGDKEYNMERQSHIQYK